MNYLHNVSQYMENLFPSHWNGWSKYATIAGGATVGVAGIGYLWKRYQDRNLPPGPTGWPLVGVTHLVKDETFVTDLEALSKKYGDIFSFQLNSGLYIIMTSPSAIKEALVTNGDTFAGRPLSGFIGCTGIKDDIFGSPYNTGVWRENKTFLMKSLRGAGFGKTKSSEEKTLDQIESLLQHVETLAKDGKPINMRDVLPKVSVNVIFQILFEKSYDYDDPKIPEILDIVRDWSMTFNDSLFLDRMPFISYFTWHRSTVANVAKRLNAFRALVRKEVEERMQKFDPENIQCFVDIYLSAKGQQHSADRIIENTLLFITDASETIPLVVEWILLHLTYYPEVQEKMFAEINNITKGNKHVTFAEHKQLPYTEAVIREVMRIVNPVSMTVAHSVPKDTIFRGYRIPKRALIFFHLQSAHKDPTAFPDPLAFKPERFLNPDGTLLQNEAYVPFGMGRRACPGQPLAQTEVFLMVSNLVQTFKFTFPKGDEISLGASEGSLTTQLPEQFRVNATKRN